jgi:quercetin dioxygenase-like cupin family protein
MGAELTDYGWPIRELLGQLTMHLSKRTISRGGAAMRFNRRVAISMLVAAAVSVSNHAQAPSPAAGVHKLSTTLQGKVGCPAEGVETGDAAKGPSIIVEKWPPGCTIPWHWHTPNEHVMMVTGTLNFEMKGEKSTQVKAGDFVLIPSHHISQATCTGPQSCIDFLYTDAPFDVHFVDETGKEISAAPHVIK